MAPTYCRPAAYRLFCDQLDEVETTDGLLRAAFAISVHQRPEAELSATEATIKRLSEAVQSRAQSRSKSALLAHLHDVLFDLFELGGNREDYYHPANSYLPDVLKTRRGLPITLVLIYKSVAAPLGLTVYGVNAPGHFLAEVEGERSDEGSMFVDPFFGGGLLNSREIVQRVSEATGYAVKYHPEMLARATHRQWLVRMLTNLQVAFAAAGEERDIYAMQELQTLL